MTQTFDPVKSSGHVPRSVSVEDLLRRHRSYAPVASGALIDELLGTHSYYLGDELTPELIVSLAELGFTTIDVLDIEAIRTAADHVDVAEGRWDGGQIAKISGRHLLLALAMDADVGWPWMGGPSATTAPPFTPAPGPKSTM